MRIGAYVIHANAAKTLGRCIESLRRCSDEVVALDTGASDGSADLAQSLGARSVRSPWEGFGAAREAAVGALRPCDYVFFLDSDEWMDTASCVRVRAWAEETPPNEAYSVKRRNWASHEGTKYLYRTDHRTRLVSRSAARWSRAMIVHEALTNLSPVRTDIVVEHDFIGDAGERSSKDALYAVLWAVQHHHRTLRTPLMRGLLSYLAHFLGDAFFRRAMLRGGLDGLRDAHHIAMQYFRRYRLLADVNTRLHPLCELYDRGDYRGLLNKAAEAAVGV